MTLSERRFGQPPSVRDGMVRGREFADMAMSVDIEDVLTRAKHVRSIGKAAARISGERLQYEGDGDSMQLILAAYEAIYDVTKPSFLSNGVDETVRLFKSDTTHTTLTYLSAAMDSYAFSTVTREYAKKGDNLILTEDGLSLQDDFVITEKMKARRGGCPYAKRSDAKYFNRFTDHVVDTYARAYAVGMPDRWLDRIHRTTQMNTR